jgi:hypothetical protein
MACRGRNVGNTESGILFKIYFSHILQVWMFLPFFIDKKARTCGLVKAPCTGGVPEFF